MKNLFFVTQRLKNRAEKLDRFFFTYVRVFDEEDTKKSVKKTFRSNFINSLTNGPLPLLVTIGFPYTHFLGYVEQVYMVPVYFITFMISREILSQISYRSNLRYKEKMYIKYKEKAVLTKDEVIEIEEAMKRESLRLEAQKIKELPAKEKNKT